MSKKKKSVPLLQSVQTLQESITPINNQGRNTLRGHPDVQVSNKPLLSHSLVTLISECSVALSV